MRERTRREEKNEREDEEGGRRKEFEREGGFILLAICKSMD